MVVANYLRNYGFARDVRAFGFGESRFPEISLKLAVEERYRLARRVDIVIREQERKGDSG